MPVIARYATVTLIPFVLIVIGATLWGGAAALALLWLTLIAAGMDTLLDPPKPSENPSDPWADRLSVVLGIAHLTLLPVVLVALAGGGLSLGAWLALFLATASFFGQVSHPNAHELIHRQNRGLRALGATVYTSVGFGHHVSAHRLVHHRFVGTEDDPNTPLPGESFWAYLPRAWVGSFQSGLAREEERLDRKDLPAHSVQNPYLLWVGGAALSLGLAMWAAGFVGGVLLILLALLTGAQILMSDYIQHYGLQRLELDNGRMEPVGAHHSWNAPKGFSSCLMLNAPAHSEHHMHPDRPYDRLDPGADVPTLPYSMPVMAMLATIPAAWQRVMDRRALRVMEAAQHRLKHAPPIRPRRPVRAEPAAETPPEPVQEVVQDDTDSKVVKGPFKGAPPPAPTPDDVDALLARVARASD